MLINNMPTKNANEARPQYETVCPHHACEYDGSSTPSVAKSRLNEKAAKHRASDCDEHDKPTHYQPFTPHAFSTFP